MRQVACWTAAVALAVLLAGPSAGAQTGPLRIAAASDLQAVFPALAKRFTAETHIVVIPSFGSSGNFFAQIQNGAPFDLFFSADVDYPRRLTDAGQADASTLYTYAFGHLVLWTRKDSGVDVRRGFDVLRDPRVRRVAVANPQFAPYGRAAVAALKTAGFYDAVQAKLVLGENISQTAQLADSGNADVAVLALSLARGPALQRSGTYLEIAAAAHPPIEQAAVIVRSAANREAAVRFLAFLRTRAARDLLRSYGFEPPDEKR